MWAKLDDLFPSHPKIVGLSDAAFRLHVAGICYCARHLTDGLISSEAVTTLVPRQHRRALGELVDRGLWHSHPAAAVYEIHDYTDWNPTRAEVESERKRRAEAGRRGAERRWHT